MSATYPLVFGFGILLLAAWTGWGAALERLVLGRPEADRSLQAGWGLAWTVVVGGALNFVGWVRPATTLLFVAAGLAWLAWEGRRRRHRVRARWRWWRAGIRRRPVLALMGTLLVLMLLCVYAANVCTTRFNDHDDLQAYFVYPAKMIQTGAMGPDPYSERRIVSLGGMSFLHATVLAVADWRYLVVIDPGVSLLLACALLLGMAREARAGPWVAALAILLLLAVPPPRVNVTSLVSGLALFLTLFRTLSRFGPGSPAGKGGAVLVALVAAGLCSLKSTFVPACALMVAGTFLLEGLHSRRPRAALLELALSGGMTFAFMAPWMIALDQSNGTMLYPFLGRGFHGSAYGSSWLAREGLTLGAVAEGLRTVVSDPRVLPAWILGAGLVVRTREAASRAALLAFFVAAVVSNLALTALHPKPSYRYSWAFLFACILTLVVCSAFAAPAVGRRRAPAVVLSGALAVGILVFAHSGESTRYWRDQPRQMRLALKQSRSAGFKRRWARRYALMQESVPEGAVLLTRLQYPFTLDFTRGTIFIADYPGGSSPPPGMPFSQGGERLADYLCAQDVDYVAYSYRGEGGFDRARWGHRLGPDTHPWTRAQSRLTFDFQDNLLELGRTRYRVHDDGDVFVVDLARASSGAAIPCAAAGSARPRPSP